MDKKYLTSTDIKKLFQLDASPQTLLNYEEKGEIPKAERIPRGKVSVRHWKLEQIPAIGSKVGFLKKPKKQIVICKYIQKGGVLKTTTSLNKARCLALNGIKTLIIGLDSECSITDALLPKPNIETLKDNPTTKGLYHLLTGESKLNQVIQHTDLPTLDIIPETYDLVSLEKWLNQQSRKEYFFKDYLLPKLSEYDVIIFDNSPSWSCVIENAIVASNTIISPLGCGLLAYNAANTNVNSLFDFIKAMKMEGQKKILMFGTMLDRTSISQQIYGQYLVDFKDYLINAPIRRSVRFEESLVYSQSILEYAPTSSVAREYFELLTTLWEQATSD